MYFYNYGLINPSLVPNKEKFGDVDCLVSLKWATIMCKNMSG